MYRTSWSHLSNLLLSVKFLSLVDLFTVLSSLFRSFQFILCFAPSFFVPFEPLRMLSSVCGAP